MKQGAGVEFTVMDRPTAGIGRHSAAEKGSSCIPRSVPWISHMTVCQVFCQKVCLARQVSEIPPVSTAAES